MSKTLKTRILLKTDLTENWEKANDSFIPKRGEVCIYLDRIKTDELDENGESIFIPGIKVGDGSSYINELEFIGEIYITTEEIEEMTNIKIYNPREVRL